MVNDDGGVGAVPARLVVVGDGVRRRPLRDAQRFHCSGRGECSGVETEMEIEMEMETKMKAEM